MRPTEPLWRLPSVWSRPKKVRARTDAIFGTILSPTARLQRNNKFSAERGTQRTCPLHDRSVALLSEQRGTHPYACRQCACHAVNRHLRINRWSDSAKGPKAVISLYGRRFVLSVVSVTEERTNGNAAPREPFRLPWSSFHATWLWLKTKRTLKGKTVDHP